MRQFELAGRAVGAGAPCFIIAEAGVNHNGELALARKLVEAAADAGADAVKFQTFRADRLVAPSSPKAAYQIETTGGAESQYEMLRRLELSEAMHLELIRQCEQLGLTFISTPFDEESADLLERLDLPAMKLPSGELTNLPLLRHIARKGRPMLISTGMAGIGEVEAAVRAVEQAGARDVALLHCVSNYPADPAAVNLRAMKTMERAFGYPVGYSDHTLGSAVALAAVALGAAVIEKHFTLDTTLPGPDHRASIEPAELRELVRGIRAVEQALGDGVKRATPDEADVAAVARRRLVAAQDIEAGVPLREQMVALRRAGAGLEPVMLPHVLGRRPRRRLAAGEPLTFEVLD
ncbi:MAG TPA: N-acetylneuraminate synthase [Chloroflexaceae bacterium]|nr:N-acetylneuraminate synthase [Chloroflexaceae bacterium]